MESVNRFFIISITITEIFRIKTDVLLFMIGFGTSKSFRNYVYFIHSGTLMYVFIQPILLLFVMD